MKHAGGRPTKFTEEVKNLIRDLTRAGKTEKQICKLIQINESTLAKFKKRNSEFFRALKNWKLEADEKVERSLYERACGYSHPEDDIRFVDHKIVITPTIKHYPPDTVACIFWLKNRQPARWRDKQEIDIDAKGLAQLILEARERRKKAEKGES